MPCLTARIDADQGGRTDCVLRIAAEDGIEVLRTEAVLADSTGGHLDIVPLCHRHKDEVGEAGTSQRADFERRYGLDLRAEADRIALGHEPPLGIRGLAERWASVQPVDLEECVEYVYAGVLDIYEREALLGWVRRRMVSATLEVLVDSEAEGQEWMVDAVGCALGRPFAKGDGTKATAWAWSLCEVAGWPS
jgi:hypothetical protein